jgi:hypothetical protein
VTREIPQPHIHPKRGTAFRGCVNPARERWVGSKAKPYGHNRDGGNNNIHYLVKIATIKGCATILVLDLLLKIYVYVT